MLELLMRMCYKPGRTFDAHVTGHFGRHTEYTIDRVVVTKVKMISKQMQRNEDRKYSSEKC